ncbi:uncharacterized protein hhla2b.2 [Misgurnus anguillicaudatus]|uniref:uncharacterized protein hhla2b.2 n=1 Tax=Misgurnus anguillicaudatus TaxID=75329 RepID=UPI003CCFD826
MATNGTSSFVQYSTMKLVTGILSFIWILPLTLSGDVRVTCLYSEECVLPCKSALHDIIHWNKQDKTVHSFYHQKDQLDYQSKEYKGRTSMFSQSEINNGNVSLILKQIRIQDEGRYKCYAASDKLNDEKYVAVSVVAPVKSVDITFKKDTVTCSTSGVYPEPTVLWSSEPAVEEPGNNYSNKTDENLFVVTSELKIGNVNHNYTYNCSITNKKDNSRLYTATLKQQEISVTDEVTLPCPFTKDNKFILTFSTNVLRYNSQTSDQQISDAWKDKVSFSPEDGTIKLYNLNKEHFGTYTCKTTTTEITSTEHTVSGNEVTFKCPVTKDHNYNFTLNFDTTVLSYNSQTSTKLISDQWKNRIVFPSEDTGAVKLNGLNNKEHSGTYTCMSSTAQNKYIIHTVVTLTDVIAHAHFVIPLVIFFVVLILAFVIIFRVRKKLPCWKSRETGSNEAKDNSSSSEKESLNDSGGKE